MSLTHIDFFINNKCNLNCSSCYVDSKMDQLGNISLSYLEKALTNAINQGVRTIGCTGKEPLIDFERTKEILTFLQKKKKGGANILYGLVTNGILLNAEKSKILNKLELDYLDVSVDGTEKVHDGIRGKGNYQKTMNNLESLLNLDLEHLNKNNIFIDFTLSRTNKDTISNLTTELSKKGLQNIYISPYQAIQKDDSLTLNSREYAEFVKGVLNDSERYNNMQLFFKNDFKTKENISELISREIIDLDNLYQDELGIVYSILKKDNNKFYFNLLKKSSNIILRINSNGDITSCYDMFKGQKYSSFGNIKTENIGDIIKS